MFKHIKLDLEFTHFYTIINLDNVIFESNIFFKILLNQMNNCATYSAFAPILEFILYNTLVTIL